VISTPPSAGKNSEGDFNVPLQLEKTQKVISTSPSAGKNSEGDFNAPFSWEKLRR